MSDKFPKWGFWTKRNEWYKRINVTPTVHLFLNEKKTACGYIPNRNPAWFQFMQYEYSEVPKIGIYDVYCESNSIKKPTIDDFKKCRTCLKKETEEE